MPNLFAHAAASLMGETSEPAGADVLMLLTALGYVAEAGETGPGAETRHRADLLRVASRFSRVFELDAPDAPGLVSFGAQFDPAIADTMHAGGRRSAFPAWAFRRKMPFRDVSAKASNIYRNCKTGTICCNHWNRASRRLDWVHRRARSSRRSRRTGCATMPNLHGVARRG